MPELPEVETVRRSLLDRVVGSSVADVTLAAFPGIIGDMSLEEFRSLTIGETFADIQRRGKNLWLPFRDGSGLHVHLRMTGQLLIVRPDHRPIRFEHLRLGLDTGWSLVYADQRKFGRVLWLDDATWEEASSRVGPEPLDDGFDLATFDAIVEGRSAPIKAVILDQRRVAGIGNIYADEALYRARIHPNRPAGSLDATERADLLTAIRTVLLEGIDRRGTTLSNYRDANGTSGTNASNLRVYGRGDKGTCDRCGNPIARIRVVGRTTHFCPNCQPANDGIASEQ